MGARRLRYFTSGLLVAALVAADAATDDSSRPAAEALAEFQKAWKPLTGREYMRPLDDTGWKARSNLVLNAIIDRRNCARALAMRSAVTSGVPNAAANSGG